MSRGYQGPTAAALGGAAAGAVVASAGIALYVLIAGIARPACYANTWSCLIPPETIPVVGSMVALGVAALLVLWATTPGLRFPAALLGTFVAYWSTVCAFGLYEFAGVEPARPHWWMAVLICMYCFAAAAVAATAGSTSRVRVLAAVVATAPLLAIFVVALVAGPPQ